MTNTEIFKKIVGFIRRVIFKRSSYNIPPEEESGYIVPEIWRIERRKILEDEVKRLRLMGFAKQAKRLENKLEKER